jgi:hypothetical protein
MRHDLPFYDVFTADLVKLGGVDRRRPGLSPRPPLFSFAMLITVYSVGLTGVTDKPRHAPSLTDAVLRSLARMPTTF